MGRAKGLQDKFEPVIGNLRGSTREDIPLVTEVSLLDFPCIQRTAHGTIEALTFADWAEYVIQDGDVAQRVAYSMLDGDVPYSWNEEEPQFYEEFDVLNGLALRQQLEADQ